MPQITTDGMALYAAPIAEHFGLCVPYVQTVKRYAGGGGGRGVTSRERRSATRVSAPCWSRFPTYHAITSLDVRHSAVHVHCSPWVDSS